jgi:hypothetical protein
MTRQQPADEWDFVPTDDDEAGGVVAPEIAAMHAAIRPARTPARDLGRTDVDLGEEDPGPAAVTFDDEELDAGVVPDDESSDADVDLEDLLESQHYAFDGDAGDAVTAD